MIQRADTDHGIGPFFMEKAMQKQQLYQVRVLLSDDKAIDVGPKMIKEAAEQFRDAIEANIRLGREKLWHDPIIYPIYH